MVEQTRTHEKFPSQLILVALLSLPLLATGCHRHQPGGQTIATVDGQDITTNDLQLALANVPADQRKQLQPKAVQTLVDRAVLAEYAKSQGIDRSPGYVIQLRAMTQGLLAQLAARQIAGNAQQPLSVSEVNEYLDAHPDMASNRRILAVDQVQFPTPTPAILEELKNAKSPQELLGVFRHHSIQIAHSQGQIDTATVQDAIAAKLDTLQPGEPLIILSRPRSSAITIVDSKPSPLQGDAAMQLARQRINSEKGAKALNQRGLALRQQAKISYANGYDPKPAKAGS